jgi:hypothetical protein
MQTPRAETTQRITDQLAGAACTVYQLGPSTQELEMVVEGAEARFSGCDMKLDISTLRGSSGTLYEFRVSLMDLDASGIAVLEGAKVPAGWIVKGDKPTHVLRLVTKGLEKTIAMKTEEMVGEAKPVTSDASEIDIRIIDKERAEKLAKAFADAIAECGG